MAEYIFLAAAVVSVAGTVYSAVSSHQAASAAEHTEKKQGYMIAEQARVREEQQRLNAKRLLATQKSRLGASGITMEGSPLLNQMETQAQFEKDLLNIRRGTQMELSTMSDQARAYETTGNVRVGTTLLTGLGNNRVGLHRRHRQLLIRVHMIGVILEVLLIQVRRKL